MIEGSDRFRYRSFFMSSNQSYGTSCFAYAETEATIRRKDHEET